MAVSKKYIYGMICGYTVSVRKVFVDHPLFKKQNVGTVERVWWKTNIADPVIEYDVFTAI